jgi:hypothetical protein
VPNRGNTYGESAVRHSKPDASRIESRAIASIQLCLEALDFPRYIGICLGPGVVRGGCEDFSQKSHVHFPFAVLAVDKFAFLLWAVDKNEHAHAAGCDLSDRCPLRACERSEVIGHMYRETGN